MFAFFFSRVGLQATGNASFFILVNGSLKCCIFSGRGVLGEVTPITALSFFPGISRRVE